MKAIVFLAALTLAGAVNAAVIFNGFGAGDSFEVQRFVSSSNTDVGIPGNTSTDRDWAAAFMPSGSDYTLISIEIALSLVLDAN